tara:strand:+ start:4145 stop:4429 length:285 start_codon:yes stop_codon:yes gene_type:complete
MTTLSSLANATVARLRPARVSAPSRARLFTQLFLTDSTVSAHRHLARARAFADVIAASPFAPESLSRVVGGVSDTMTRVGHRLTQRVVRERTNE